MKKSDDINEWVKRAKSNLLLSKIKKVSREIYYEDLCYDAQQCAEKSLKALCIFFDIKFPKTHNLSHLIELLKDKEVKIPKSVKKAELISDYSVETRYPGDYEEVDEKEYKRVVKIAEDVYNWVNKKVKF